MHNTLSKSLLLITPGGPCPGRQKPLKTSSIVRPERLTALLTRSSTCSAPGGDALCPPDDIGKLTEPPTGISNPIAISSRTASRSAPTMHLKRSANSLGGTPRLKEFSPDTKSSRLMKPRPAAARCLKKSAGVSPCDWSRCRIFRISSTCRGLPTPRPEFSPPYIP